VVFLQGGPGGEAVFLSADNYDVLVKPFLSKRDYIAFDQRGTAYRYPPSVAKSWKRFINRTSEGRFLHPAVIISIRMLSVPVTAQ